MEARPTIYDVAESAGVAPSTVSRAFARPGRVNADTAARIFAVARELGYRSTTLAGPASRPTRTLALVVTDITNPFYAEIIRGAHEAAADLGYTVRLAHTQEDAHIERAWIEHELPTIDGVILASSRMSDSAIRTLAKQRPVLVLNRRLPEVPCLLVDNEGGMRRAMEHLHALGHSSVTYVSGPEASWTDGVRWRALKEAASTYDMRLRRLGPNQEPTIAAGFARVRDVLTHSSTAVVAFNDALAIGVIKGLSRLGVIVPDDISVVGMDNVLLAEVIEPELTTVASPLRAQGNTAVRNLVAMTTGAVSSGEPLTMPAKLLVRRSTAQRSRKRVSPAFGTTSVSGVSRSAARSRDAGST